MATEPSSVPAKGRELTASLGGGGGSREGGEARRGEAGRMGSRGGEGGEGEEFVNEENK
jgi:hypothetical protein